MYRLYGSNLFQLLNVDKEEDPELWKFIEETRTKGPHFSNYTTVKLENFISRIYELRKDNSNNPT